MQSTSEALAVLEPVLRQLSHRIRNDEEHRRAFEDQTERRFIAVDEARREDRREILDTFARFEDRLDKRLTRDFGAMNEKLIDVCDKGKRDHGRYESKLEAHDQMLDDLANVAAEKRGAAKVWQGALSFVSNHPSLALCIAGALIGASWAPRLFEAEVANAAPPAIIAAPQQPAYAKAQIPPPIDIRGR